MQTLDTAYSIEIDKIDDSSWSTLLLQFDDASIYQTIAYGSVMYGKKNISHIIIKNNAIVVAIAQIGIRRFPQFFTGTADVYWGPLWRKKDVKPDLAIFDKIMDALKKEYAIKRKLLLRIWPNENDTAGNELKNILLKNNFRYNSKERPYRTLRLCIDQPIEALRKNLDQKWRNQLNKAEKSNLTIDEGQQDNLYQIFLELQKEMMSRKNYTPGVNYDEYRKIQEKLPEPLKMKIMICKYEDEPVSSAICSYIGNTGIYMLGATGDKGMKVNGSNLLQWCIIQWLKKQNCQFYDLGGIDPEINPGVYRFKCGVVGKLGEDVSHVGQFVFYNNWRAALLQKVIIKSKKIRSISTALKHENK